MSARCFTIRARLHAAHSLSRPGTDVGEGQSTNSAYSNTLHYHNDFQKLWHNGHIMSECIIIRPAKHMTSRTTPSVVPIYLDRQYRYTLKMFGEASVSKMMKFDIFSTRSLSLSFIWNFIVCTVHLIYGS